MKNYALYRASVATFSSLKSTKYGPVEIQFVFEEDFCLVNTK